MLEKTTTVTTIADDDIAARKARLAARIAEINNSSEKEMLRVMKLIERAKTMFRTKQI